MARRSFWLVAVLWAVSCFSTPLKAQQVAVAEVTGLVTDASGAVVPGATVKMIETDKGVTHTATSGDGGSYVLPGLPPGPYRLEVGKVGFKTYALSNIVLQVNDHATFNVTLEVGSSTETVEVSSTGPLVQTETASISAVMDAQRMVELPLNGRYVTDLVIYSGASTPAPGGDETGSKNFYSSVTISVAGGQANGTNFLLDGGDFNDTFSNVNLPYPFPDALQEFSSETSALPARNGLHPGGVMNAVTKSGSNQLHGDLFEFYRDGSFNAARRNFSLTNPTTPDALLRSQFGGTIGGKLITDKLFWFAGYQGTRAHINTAGVEGHTITDAALSGDFTNLESPACTGRATERTLGGAFNGTDKTRDARANTVSTYFDPAAAKLFTAGYMPIMPDATDPCGTFFYTVPSIDNEDQVVGRIDFILSPKQTLFGRYLIDDFRSPAPFDTHFLNLTTTPGNWERAQSVTLGHTYTFSTSLVNAFHATFNRRRDNRAPDPRDINSNALGVNMYNAVPDFLLFTISSYFNVGCGTCAPGFFNVNTVQLADDVDWIRSKHHFAYGVDFIHTQNNTLTGYDENGTWSFNGTFSGDGMADFMLGGYNGFSQSHAQKVAYRETIPSLYFQDTYKVRHNLTVEAGLRWEPTFQPYDAFYRGSQFNMQNFLSNTHTSVYSSSACPGISCPPAGMLYHGDPGIPAAFTDNHLANFAPRLGLAWDPTGKGAQSLRAGFGLFYDSSMVWYSQRLTSNPPFVDEIDNSVNCGTFSNPWLNYSTASGCVSSSGTNQNPFPGGTTIFPSGSLWVSLPPHMRPMYMEQWNLSYERQFFKEWAFSVAYLGNHSLHLPLSYEANYIETTPAVCAEFGTAGCTTKNEVQRRALYQAEGCAGTTPCTAPNYASGIGSLFQAVDSGYANYHALFADVKHRFRHSFETDVNYTYAHCLSLGDFNGDLRGTYFMNQQDPQADYGNCNFDIRHILNATLVAASPLHGHGFLKWARGGWQFAPRLRFHTGWPVNITNGTDSLATGNEGGDRPELVPGQPLYVKQWVTCNGGTAVCYQYINPNAFVNPTNATAPVVVKPAGGNAYAYPAIARDFLYAPSVFTMDAGVSRLFPMGERFRWEFRFEAFNALNHVNLRLTTIGNGIGLNGNNFGAITSAPGAGFIPSEFDPRILQFAVKFHF